MPAPAEVEAVLQPHREAQAIEDKALALWVDVQAAAMFLGRHAVSASIMFHLTGQPRAVLERFAILCGGSISAYQGATTGSWQESVEVYVAGVSVCAIRSQRTAADEVSL